MKTEKENVKKLIKQPCSKKVFTEKDIEKILGGRCVQRATKGSSGDRATTHASDNAS